MNRKYIRNIVFSKTPLNGYFGYADEFKIYPCDYDKAPKSKHAADFPLIIEFWIDEEENPEVSEDFKSIKSFLSVSTNQTNKLSRLTRLISTLTNHRIHNLTETELKWGTPFLEDLDEFKSDEINNTSSTLIMGIFTYPEIAKDLKIESFSDQRHSTVKFDTHKRYYQYDPLDSKNKEIILPNSLNHSLEKYFSLDKPTRKIVDTICHLICNGIDLRGKMKSLSFLSFVSAIETLVNYEYKDKKDGVQFECHDCQSLKSSPLTCNKCGRPIWGVKAKFKEFLKTYVSSGEETQKKFNKIYNLRSNIVHNGMLLLGDEEIDWSKSHKADSEFMTHIETMQFARLALVNWLIYGPNRKPAKQ